MRLFALYTLFVSTLLLQYASSTHIDGTVETQCGTVDSTAVITYKGDPYGVLAVNKAGKSCWAEENIAEATYTIYVKYNASGNATEDDCVFDSSVSTVLVRDHGRMVSCLSDKTVKPRSRAMKHPDMNLYSITVQGRMTFRDFENTGDEAFLVECNFDAFVDDVAGNAGIADPLTSPKVIRVDNGQPSPSNFTVSIVRIDGQPLSGIIKMGRMIMLKTEMTPVGEDNDFTVTACYAYSGGDINKTERVAILTEGCGTGIPFSKERGFLKDDDNALVAFSPFFRTFMIKRGQTAISFSCDFIICTNDTCGKSSCSTENEALAGSSRKRRSVLSPEHTREITDSLESRRHLHEVKIGDPTKMKHIKIVKGQTDPMEVYLTTKAWVKAQANNIRPNKESISNEQVKLVKSSRSSVEDFVKRKLRNKVQVFSNSVDVVETNQDDDVIDAEYDETKYIEASTDFDDSLSNRVSKHFAEKMAQKIEHSEHHSKSQHSNTDITLAIVVPICVGCFLATVSAMVTSYFVVRCMTKRMVISSVCINTKM